VQALSFFYSYQQLQWRTKETTPDFEKLTMDETNDIG
jgi:hypothetical protein